jgi:hypothetical protein
MPLRAASPRSSVNEASIARKATPLTFGSLSLSSIRWLISFPPPIQFQYDAIVLPAMSATTGALKIVPRAYPDLLDQLTHCDGAGSLVGDDALRSFAHSFLGRAHPLCSCD